MVPEDDAPEDDVLLASPRDVAAAASSLLDEEVELLLLPAGRAPGTLPSSSFQLSSPGSAAAAGSWLSAPVLCVFGSHVLARWAWRTWEFAVAILLMRLSPSSLLLVSAYGLLDNLTRLLLGSAIGGYVDRESRLRGAVTCYGLQNLCIATSAAAAALLVALQAPGRAVRPTVYWLLARTMLAGASSSVGSLGAAIAVEREYPKVLCGSDPSALSKINSGMRAIDLTCQMLAPVATGFLMTYASSMTAIVALAAFCLSVWLPECLLLQAAHRHSPALRQPKSLQASLLAAKRPHPISILLGCSGWHVYLRQPTLLAGLALALLYFTVLSLGFLMTSYLVWRGLPESTISLFRAAGALSGLAATAVFHPLQRCVGLLPAGLVGIGWQLLCLVAGVTPVLLGHLLAAPGADGSDSSSGGGRIDGRHLLHRLLAGAGALPTSANSSSAGSGGAAGVQRNERTPLVTTGVNVSNAGFAALGSAYAISAGIELVADASPAAGSSGTGSSPAQAAGGSGQQTLLVLLSGLVASRLGLWLFDLAVLQLQQELVAEHELGIVGGVQSSIQSLFEILSFTAGAAFHKPQQFWVLMVASCGSVAAAAGLYLSYVCRGGTAASSL